MTSRSSRAATLLAEAWRTATPLNALPPESRPRNAAEAYRIGLVNRVVPAAELSGAAEGVLRQMLAQGPIAVMLAIDAVNRGLESTLDEGLQIEASHFGLLAATEDMREGMRAFLEKRQAAFQGR